MKRFVVLALSLTACAIAQGHHSFSTEYDGELDSYFENQPDLDKQ